MSESSYPADLYKVEMETNNILFQEFFFFLIPPEGECTVPGSTAIPCRCVEWTEQAPIPTPNPKNPFNILSSDRGRIRY